VRQMVKLDVYRFDFKGFA